MRGSQLIEHVNTRKHQGTCRPPHQGNRACEHLSTDCNCPSLGNRACEHTETPRNMSATLDRATPSMVQRTSLNQRGWSSKGDKDRERDVQQNECTNGDTAATEHNRASHDIPDGWKPASRDIPHATTTPIPTTNKHHTMLTTPCP